MDMTQTRIDAIHELQYYYDRERTRAFEEGREDDNMDVLFDALDRMLDSDLAREIESILEADRAYNRLVDYGFKF